MAVPGFGANYDQRDGKIILTYVRVADDPPGARTTLPATGFRVVTATETHARPNMYKGHPE
jgi:hypothetical protein